MKKTYNSPALTVVKIHTMGMIAISTQEALSNATDYSEGGTLSGSRRGSVWDDEEDE